MRFWFFFGSGRKYFWCRKQQQPHPMNLYRKHIANKQNPKAPGVYNTDKGELFWFEKEMVWSCRHDRISEEYPNYWYELFVVPNKINKKKA